MPAHETTGTNTIFGVINVVRLIGVINERTSVS